MTSINPLVNTCQSFSEIQKLIEGAQLSFSVRKGTRISIPSTGEKIKLSEIEKHVQWLCNNCECSSEERRLLDKIALNLQIFREDSNQAKQKRYTNASIFVRLFIAGSCQQKNEDYSFICEKYFNAEELSSCLNDSTLIGDPLHHFPKSKLFITDTGHCLLIDEIDQMLKAQNRLYNPYTHQHFSEADYKKLQQNSTLAKRIQHLSYEQSVNATKISDETVQRLKTLAEGLLNPVDIWKGSHETVSTAEKAYFQFNEYYQNLATEEREALDRYWVGGIASVSVGMDGYVEGSRATRRFGEFYAEMNKECVHSVAAVIVDMVKRLQPEIQFTTRCREARIITDTLSTRAQRPRRL